MHSLEGDYRYDLLKSIEASSLRLRNAVERFTSHKAIYPINREELESFPLLVWKDIGDGVKIRKRKNRFNDLLAFDTVMEEGSEFGEHFHDDVIESCEVVYGEMVDMADGKIYRKGDVAHYANGKKHRPVAVEETKLHVLFK